MELDEMKLAWQELDARVRHTLTLNLRLLQDIRVDKVQRSLRPLWWGQWLQLAIGGALAVFGGVLWTTHLHQAVVLACGLAAHAYGLLLVIFSARNLYLVWRIDCALPVLELQRRLAALRAFRVRVETPVNTIVGCFIWIPVLWVSLSVHGIDLWSPGLIEWALASGFAGLIAIALAVWLMRRFGYGQKVDDVSAGGSIVRAQAALDEIARFERE